ncbi:hypothetical protein S40288_11501 [Stachybotrys chartarum IBT 40288]|nr:hypothetical protein S40288_11501 [Stachybotrys chartarum IBT 40288]
MITIAPESLKELTENRTLRCLLKTKYACNSRHSSKVIKFAYDLVQEFTDTLLADLRTKHANPMLSADTHLNIVALRRQGRFFICYDLFLGECNERDKIVQSTHRSIHLISKTGDEYHLARGKGWDAQVAYEYESLKKLDKGPLPFFTDLENPPAYEEGMLRILNISIIPESLDLSIRSFPQALLSNLPDMRMPSNLQIGVHLDGHFVSLQDAAHERPEDVRLALITALASLNDNPTQTGSHVQLLSNFYKTLQSSPRRKPYRIKGVLQRMQEQRNEESLEATFYRHGGVRGVVVLELAQVNDRNTMTLLRKLPADEMALLLTQIDCIALHEDIAKMVADAEAEQERKTKKRRIHYAAPELAAKKYCQNIQAPTETPAMEFPVSETMNSAMTLTDDAVTTLPDDAPTIEITAADCHALDMMGFHSIESAMGMPIQSMDGMYQGVPVLDLISVLHPENR